MKVNAVDSAVFFAVCVDMLERVSLDLHCILVLFSNAISRVALSVIADFVGAHKCNVIEDSEWNVETNI